MTGSFSSLKDGRKVDKQCSSEEFEDEKWSGRFGTVFEVKECDLTFLFRIPSR